MTNPRAFIQGPFDPASPPAGVRLQVNDVAQRLGISHQQLADAAGIGKTTCFRILAENHWPENFDRGAIQQAMGALLAERGASDDELRTLWHALVRASNTRRRNSIAPLPPGSTAGGLAAPPREPKETDVLLPRQTLDMDARRAFGLLFNIFDASVQTEAQMFVDSNIAFIREACWQAAAGGRFVALVAESGAGKTTIVQDLEARIAAERKPVKVIRPSVLGMEDSDKRGHTLKSNDILAATITALDPLATVPQTVEARTKKAVKLLGGSIEAGFAHLLLIEEAHCLPVATLKHLKRLNELHVARRPMLGVLLLAQPELMHKLDPTRADLREVTQRCEVVQLMPLGPSIKPYLEHRAKAAARRLEEFITDDGIEAIEQRLTVKRSGRDGTERKTSLTYPLAVNNWMTAALNKAAAIGAPAVTADVVKVAR
jgi:type II secretory pathway predicted ATPase ExeA